MWDYATAEPEDFPDKRHAMVGAWGLRMARQLVDDHGVPVAILNGAMGGTKIEQHLPGEVHDDTGTFYGRLLFRAQAAGVAQGAKALLWYQGESDYDTPLPATTPASARSSGAWGQDYPGLQRLYVVQIRHSNPGDEVIREYQRTVPDRFPFTTVMSTTAVPYHDGLHYPVAGHEEIGTRIGRLVARDFYGSGAADNVEPPNVRAAKYNNAAGDQILLTMRDPDDVLTLDAGAEEHFELSDGTAVTLGSASGNTILLQLAQPSTATTIDYKGKKGGMPLCACIPWVTNANGVGLLTFFDFPIDPF